MKARSYYQEIEDDFKEELPHIMVLKNFSSRKSSLIGEVFEAASVWLWENYESWQMDFLWQDPDSLVQIDNDLQDQMHSYGVEPNTPISELEQDLRSVIINSAMALHLSAFASMSLSDGIDIPFEFVVDVGDHEISIVAGRIPRDQDTFLADAFWSR